MRFVILPLLLALAAAAPSPQDFEYVEKFLFTTGMYNEKAVIYKGDHDIVDIVVPLNTASDLEEGHGFKNKMLIFFVEADVDEDGKKNYQGIYVYRAGKVHKVLENGKAVAASADDSPYVFFGGDDGLYLYEPDTMSAKRYGDFDYSIKAMAKESNNDIIYILTDDHEVYKVSDAATRKDRINELTGAEEIVIDYANNLYYFGADKQPYVRRNNGEIEKIQGLPEVSYAKLIRPMLFSEGVTFLADNKLYAIYPNGTSEVDSVEFDEDAKPTAFSVETFVFKYFGHNKKIYEFSLFSENDEVFNYNNQVEE